MERLVPIAVAFALGAVAASFAPMPIGNFATAGAAEEMIQPIATATRYPLPAYAARLAAFKN